MLAHLKLSVEGFDMLLTKLLRRAEPQNKIPKQTSRGWFDHNKKDPRMRNPVPHPTQ